MVSTLGAVEADRQRQASVDAAAVDQHRAGAALAAIAALLGSREIEPLAQQIEERHPGVVELDVSSLPVEGQSNGEGHGILRPMSLL